MMTIQKHRSCMPVHVESYFKRDFFSLTDQMGKRTCGKMLL